jgi:hypothetical protein
MNPYWNLHTLPLFAVEAVSLALCLFLFVTVKGEVRSLERGLRRERDQFQAELATAASALDEMRACCAELQASVRVLEDSSGALASCAPARSGINLSVRSQVLRRHRGGEDSAQIAAQLGVPRNEVALLLKVNQLMLRSL